jgi:hypothetical protein
MDPRGRSCEWDCLFLLNHGWAVSSYLGVTLNIRATLSLELASEGEEFFQVGTEHSDA